MWLLNEMTRAKLLESSSARFTAGLIARAALALRESIERRAAFRARIDRHLAPPRMEPQTYQVTFGSVFDKSGPRTSGGYQAPDVRGTVKEAAPAPLT